MPASCWPQIAALQGRTLHTVARHKAFTVTQVAHAHVELTVQDGGRTRILYRKDLEPFYERLVRQGVLTIAEIKTVYKFNSSLAAGLLAALPGVTAMPQPITLRYKR
jgi:hypothetical protein